MGSRPLAGAVAVVTGSSRGGGRGIALALGDAGATVYVTGRSSRETGATQGRPETVEETAELVTERGGSGVAVRCDHTDDDAVRELFERVAGEAGRLDVLVSNAWGGYERSVEMAPFWETPMEHWDLMFDAGLRAQVVTAREAAPLLLDGGRLVVNTLSPVGERYQGSLFYDLVNRAKRRLTVTMAHELRPRGVAVVGVAPGFMRTERVLDHFGVDADGWGDVPALEKTESPEYTGRVVAALAADPRVLERTGAVYETGELARAYGVADVDGRTPPPFSELHPDLY